MKDFVKKHNLIFEVLEATLLFSFLFFIVAMTEPFYTNDEMIMRSIAQGYYTGFNDYHLVYINPILGVIITVLYRFFSTIPWYDVIILSTHILSIVLIAKASAKLVKSELCKKISFVLAFIVLVFIDFCYLIYSMYTIVSAVAFAQGLIFLFLLSNNLMHKRMHALISMVGFLLSLMIRKQVFFMGLPVAGILLLYIFASRHKEITYGIVKYVFALAIGVVLCLITEKVCYSSDEWSAFKTFNGDRTSIIDFYGVPLYDYTKEVYERNEMSEASYHVLARHDISLVEAYDYAAARELSEAGKNIFVTTKRAIPGVKYAWYELKEELNNVRYQPIGVTIIIIVVLNLFVGICTKDYRTLIACALGITYQVVFSMLFIYLGRFPERVSYGLYFIGLIFQVCMLLENSKKVIISNRLLAYAICVIMMTPFLIYFARVQNYRISVNEEAAKKDINMTKKLYEYTCENSDCVFLIDSSVGKSETDRMLDNQYRDMDNIFNMSFWLEKSPIFTEKKHNRGIVSFEDSLISRDDVLFVQSSDSDIEWINNYYIEKGYFPVVKVVDTVIYDGGSFDVIAVCTD